MHFSADKQNNQTNKPHATKQTPQLVFYAFSQSPIPAHSLVVSWPSSLPLTLCSYQPASRHALPTSSQDAALGLRKKQHTKLPDSLLTDRECIGLRLAKTSCTILSRMKNLRRLSFLEAARIQKGSGFRTCSQTWRWTYSGNWPRGLKLSCVSRWRSMTNRKGYGRCKIIAQPLI